MKHDMNDNYTYSSIKHKRRESLFHKDFYQISSIPNSSIQLDKGYEISQKKSTVLSERPGSFLQQYQKNQKSLKNEIRVSDTCKYALQKINKEKMFHELGSAQSQWQKIIQNQLILLDKSFKQATNRNKAISFENNNLILKLLFNQTRLIQLLQKDRPSRKQQINLLNLEMKNSSIEFNRNQTNLYWQTALKNMERASVSINNLLKAGKFESAAIQISVFLKTYFGEQQTKQKAIVYRAIQQLYRKYSRILKIHTGIINVVENLNDFNFDQFHQNANIVKINLKQLNSIIYLLDKQRQSQKDLHQKNVCAKFKQFHQLLPKLNHDFRNNSQTQQDNLDGIKDLQRKIKIMEDELKKNGSNKILLQKHRQKYQAMSLNNRIAKQKTQNICEKIKRKQKWQDDLTIITKCKQICDEEPLKFILELQKQMSLFYNDKISVLLDKLTHLLSSINQILKIQGFNTVHQVSEVKKRIQEFNLSNNGSNAFCQQIISLIQTINSFNQVFEQNIEKTRNSQASFQQNNSYKNQRAYSTHAKTSARFNKNMKDSNRSYENYTSLENITMYQKDKSCESRKNKQKQQQIHLQKQRNYCQKQIIHGVQLILNKISQILLHSEGEITSRLNILNNSTGSLVDRYPQFETIYKLIRNWIKILIPRLLTAL